MRNALVALAACAAPCAAQAQLGINIYGLSYHFDRDVAKSRGHDNPFNPGLGLRYRKPGEKFDGFLDGGFYYDSGRNTTVYAGGGLFWNPTVRLRLGGAVGYFNSDTYKNGEPFIAPLPLAAYEWRKVTLNVAYAPRIGDINTVHTLGFWLTFWP